MPQGAGPRMQATGPAHSRAPGPGARGRQGDRSASALGQRHAAKDLSDEDVIVIDSCQLVCGHKAHHFR